MEGSAKHTRRLDEELKKETTGMVQGGAAGSRVEEGKMTEDPGSMQPIHDPAPRPDGVMTRDEIEMRSAIARAIDGSIFPADRERLVQNARDHDTPSEIVAALQRLPEGIRFINVESVWEALGGDVERRRG
jgi:hypothetical protein